MRVPSALLHFAVSSAAPAGPLQCGLRLQNGDAASPGDNKFELCESGTTSASSTVCHMDKDYSVCCGFLSVLDAPWLAACSFGWWLMAGADLF
jgi:hypothetical protein